MQNSILALTLVALASLTGCSSTSYTGRVNTPEATGSLTKTKTATSDDTTSIVDTSAKYKACWAEAERDIINLINPKDPRFVEVVTYWKNECYRRAKYGEVGLAAAMGQQDPNAQLVPSGGGYAGANPAFGTGTYPMDTSAQIALDRYPGAALVVPGGPGGYGGGGQCVAADGKPCASTEQVKDLARVVRGHDCKLKGGCKK